MKGKNYLIFLCWFIYTVAYLGRYSYTTNVVLIISEYGITRAEAGLVSTCFFIVYGIGQVVNGLLCKKYAKRWLLGGALVVSAIVNLAIGCGVPFTLYKYLWIVNGAAQSFLWSSVICILGDYLPAEKLKTATLVMSTSVTVGTFVSYGMSALFSWLNIFRGTFIFAGLLLAAGAFLWTATYNGVATNEKVSLEEVETSETKNKLPVFILCSVILLGIFAVVDNLVKDGLSTWVPSILKEEFGMNDSLSVLLTLSLSAVGVLGSFLAMNLYKKIKDHIVICGIFFLAASILLAVVLAFINTEAWLLILLCFCVICCVMSGINNVITAMAPLYLRNYINSGLLAGILDGCCYVGSAISAYGLGSLADGNGWGGVFVLMLLLCVFPVLLSGIFSIVFLIRKKGAK